MNIRKDTRRVISRSEQEKRIHELESVLKKIHILAQEIGDDVDQLRFL